MAEEVKTQNTQQATAPQPAAPAPREKNPKRVAAGKMVAERTRISREQQKKALAEAQVYLANRKNSPAGKSNSANDDAGAVNPVSADTRNDDGDSTLKRVYNDGLTTNQWLSVIGIGVSLLGIYYFRESLKRKAGEQFAQNPKTHENGVENGPANVRRIRNLD